MSDRYSLNRRDKKLAGACSTIGDMFNIDPTFVRIGLVAFAIFVSWEVAVVAVCGAGVCVAVARSEARRGGGRRGGFGRLGEIGRTRASVHDMRTKLDVNDRRMMAIDHHLSTQNDELAREIEALREAK